MDTFSAVCGYPFPIVDAARLQGDRSLFIAVKSFGVNSGAIVPLAAKGDDQERLILTGDDANMTVSI